jgi:uncharacterized membrane protein
MDEKRIHQVFFVSVLLKGLDAAAEIVAGLALALTTQQAILRLVQWITHNELIEDPHDFVANSLLHVAQSFSVDTKTFYAYYLLSHGAIKLVMVAGLLANRLWAYPFGLVVMVLFIVYQLYEFAHTHSAGMLALTVFDVLVLYLIWHEYRLVLRHRGATR